MRPIITLKEALERRDSSKSGYDLLTEENGCVSGAKSGISIYSNQEFNSQAGFHDDQEGFYVLEGSGQVKLDDEIYDISEGDSFIAAAGVRHTVRTIDSEKPVKVFWFHSAI